MAALRAAFPEVERVYTEEVKQGFKSPCFIVRLLNPTSEQFLGNCYYRTNLLSVQYVPWSKSEGREECCKVNEGLFRALEYITVAGDLQRGTHMSAEYFDGMLSFTVNFNMFIDILPEVDPMEELTVKNQVE